MTTPQQLSAWEQWLHDHLSGWVGPALVFCLCVLAAVSGMWLDRRHDRKHPRPER